MTNRYIRDARISERKFKELVKMFCADVPALTARKEAGPMAGEVEVDESYFGARRVRGKRGRGASGKTPVIGLLDNGGEKLALQLPPPFDANVLTLAYSDAWQPSTDGSGRSARRRKSAARREPLGR